MLSVFILQHLHNVDDDSDVKFIGVYRSRADAEGARARLENKVGFRDAREGFEIAEYVLGQDHWVDGYLPYAEAIDPRDRD